jgi:hypothetical protein
MAKEFQVFQVNRNKPPSPVFARQDKPSNGLLRISGKEKHLAITEFYGKVLDGKCKRPQSED